MNSIVGTSRLTDQSQVTGVRNNRFREKREHIFKFESVNGPVELVARGARVAQW